MDAPPQPSEDREHLRSVVMQAGKTGLDGLVRSIGIISRNNSVLASMLSHLTAGEEPTDPRELRVLLQDTGMIAKETGELLLSLQQNLQQSSAHAAAPDRQRTMLTKLNKDFQFVLRRFQQLAEQSAQHARLGDLESGANAAPARLAGGGSADLPSSDDDDDERGGLLARANEATAQQQQQQQRLMARSNAETVAERERMISQVKARHDHSAMPIAMPVAMPIAMTIAEP